MAEGEFVVKKILIADDNKQIIDVLTQYAIKEDYQVYTLEELLPLGFGPGNLRR